MLDSLDILYNKETSMYFLLKKSSYKYPTDNLNLRFGFRRFQVESLLNAGFCVLGGINFYLNVSYFICFYLCVSSFLVDFLSFGWYVLVMVSFGGHGIRFYYQNQTKKDFSSIHFQIFCRFKHHL